METKVASEQDRVNEREGKNEVHGLLHGDHGHPRRAQRERRIRQVADMAKRRGA